MAYSTACSFSPLESQRLCKNKSNSYEIFIPRYTSIELKRLLNTELKLDRFVLKNYQVRIMDVLLPKLDQRRTFKRR